MSPKLHRHEELAQKLEQYILNIIGQSISHTFRTPISLINNFASFVSADSQSDRLLTQANKEIIRNSASVISGLRSSTIETFRSIGQRLRDTEEPADRATIRSALNDEVYPLISSIRAEAEKLGIAASRSKLPEIVENRGIIVSESHKMARIFGALKNLAELDASVELTTTNINRNVERTKDQIIRNFFPNQIATIDIPVSGDEVSIKAVQPLIVIVLQNLLENALRYARRSETQRVSVEVERITFAEAKKKYRLNSRFAAKGEWVSINFYNSGDQIQKETVDQMFDLFFTTEDTSDESTGGGSGIGLALCRIIAMVHGGFVQFTGRHDDLNRFSIILPTTRESRVEPLEILDQLARL